MGVEAAEESLKLEEGVEGAEEVEDCGSPWCRTFGFRVWSVATLEATQGKMDGFLSQLPYRCHLEEVASAGDWPEICPQFDSRVGFGGRSGLCRGVGEKEFRFSGGGGGCERVQGFRFRRRAREGIWP